MLEPSPQLPEQLPPLREDLQLHEAAANADGSPAWVIQDPVNNQFYRIGWLEFELLARWHLGQTDTVMAATRIETPLDPSEEEVIGLISFLQQNQLLILHSPAYTDQLIALYRRTRLSRAKWLLHHYLFFRIPLWHPDRFLQRAMPWVEWIYRPATMFALLTLTLLGFVLVARQIDLFTASFIETLSPAGLAGYLIALAVAKSFHELGHAFTATRYGVRVAHMGVAFLVLWPMLYTDTGESWRLKDRRQRLAIASAGIITELSLAALATLAWALSEPGELRQALLFLATTAWVISLALNASPFMRFDGYFILSDILDLPNLHERSSALARNAMRHWLLGWNDPDPESFPPNQRRALIAFAYTTWLYRLIVFVGIAFAVYYLFFKLLGIFLFLVEIIWFVARPIAQEIAVWRKRRSEIRPERKRVALSVAVAFMVLGLVPWNLTVRADGWIHGAGAHTLYSPLPAQIEQHSPTGTLLAEGDPSFVLTQPEIEVHRRVASEGRDALDRQLSGLAEVPGGEDRRTVLMQMRQMRQAEIDAQQREAQRLTLAAPLAGVLLDVDHELQPGSWVGPQQLLGVIVAPAHWQAEAFVSPGDRERLRVGDKARFYPQDEKLFPMTGRVTGIDETRLAQLPHTLLSTHYGGDLPVTAERNAMSPRDALYRVRIALDSPPDRMAVRRGTAVIDARPHSWLWESTKSMLLVLIREASF